MSIFYYEFNVETWELVNHVLIKMIILLFFH
jgi:hypothetical protein